MTPAPEGPRVDDGEGDEPIGVAHARDRVEAEMLQGLLESAGIASFLQPIGMMARGSASVC